MEFPKVTIVVIGHNEANNLDSCFNAIKNIDYPKDKLEVIYVDSKSTDDSIRIAKKYTENVYFENSMWPTAGEAFNRGIVQSTSDYIHITAGDIQLDPNYLKEAIKILLAREDIQAVTGYFVEKESRGWNKILSYRREEDSVEEPHFISTPNGGTFKKYALLEVNGYDERIKKGQETDLGKSFKEKGFKIWFLNIPQGVHDFELNSFWDMIRRSFINGFSLGYLFLLSFFEKDNKNILSFRKSSLKLILFHSFMLLLLIITLFVFSPIYLLVWLGMYLLYYPANIMIRQRNKTFKHKIYFLISGYFSIFTYWGLLYFVYYYLINKIKGNELFRRKKGLKINTVEVVEI